MAQYRTLVDVYVGGQHILAGTTLTMPDNFVPRSPRYNQRSGRAT